MNGAIAVPSVITINTPNKIRNNIIGASHHFFRTFKYSQNSDNIDNLDIIISLTKNFRTAFHNLDSVPQNDHDHSSMN